MCVSVCPNLVFIQFMFSHFSHVPLFVTLWTTAHQVPLSMGFSRQENWSGLPYSPPGDLPDPGIKPRPPALQAGSLPSELPGWCQKVRVLLQSEAGVNSHVTKHHSWGMDMWKSESESGSLVSDSLQPHGLHSPWNSPGQNPGVGSLSLLQGIFPIQGSNPGLPHCGWILYQLSHKGNPRVLEWVAYPFSSGSF